MAYDEGN